jgi:hypothetical protein
MEEVITVASQASSGEQFLSTVLFLSFVYYIIWIPVRDKKAGKVVPNLFTRMKTDVLNLVTRFKK